MDFRNSDFAVANPDSSFTEFITIESMETLLVWYFWLVLESLRLFLEKSLDNVLDFDIIENVEPEFKVGFSKEYELFLFILLSSRF